MEQPLPGVATLRGRYGRAAQAVEVVLDLCGRGRRREARQSDGHTLYSEHRDRQTESGGLEAGIDQQSKRVAP